MDRLKKQEVNYSSGLAHRPSYEQFRENLKNSGLAPVSVPDNAARGRWLSQKEKIVPQIRTKFSKSQRNENH